MDELSSKVISFLRFPLAVGIVFLHTAIPSIPSDAVWGDGYQVYTWISSFGSKILCTVCVPAFFFISGYLFFIKVENYSMIDYKKKLQSRFKTLFIPYILWNSFLVIILLAKQLHGHSFAGIMDVNWLSCYWDYTKASDLHNLWGWPLAIAYPIDGPLWFIRDLIIASIASPFIYLWVKYTKWIGICLFGILYIFSIWPYTIIFMMANSLFFFSLGGYLGLNKKRLYFLNANISMVFFFVYVICSILMFYVRDNCSEPYYQVCVRMYNLLGVITIFNVAACLISKKGYKIPSILSNSVFFIYATHMIYINPVMGHYVVPVLFKGNHYMMLIAQYVTAPILTIAFCVLLFSLMKKICPTLLAVLNGGRL